MGGLVEPIYSWIRSDPSVGPDLASELLSRYLLSKLLETSAFCVGPVGRAATQEKTPTNHQIPITQYLRFPPVALPVKAQLAGPRHVLDALFPDAFAGARLAGRGWTTVWAVPRIIGHASA